MPQGGVPTVIQNVLLNILIEKYWMSHKLI